MNSRLPLVYFTKIPELFTLAIVNATTSIYLQLSGSLFENAAMFELPAFDAKKNIFSKQQKNISLFFRGLFPATAQNPLQERVTANVNFI